MQLASQDPEVRGSYNRTSNYEKVAIPNTPGLRLITRGSESATQMQSESSRAHLTERTPSARVGFSKRLGANSLGEGQPYCSALGRLKYGLTGNAIIQIAIASPASNDMTSIILSYLTFLSPQISRAI